LTQVVKGGKKNASTPNEEEKKKRREGRNKEEIVYLKKGVLMGVAKNEYKKFLLRPSKERKDPSIETALGC